MSLDIDYYELLEVERTADDATLKASYRKLAMKYHPDKNPGCDDSEARFKAISEAYDCLKDPQKRAAETARAIDPVLAEPVIGGALLRILQAVIGFADRLEARFAVIAPRVLVGVIFHCELAIARLQRRIVG